MIQPTTGSPNGPSSTVLRTTPSGTVAKPLVDGSRQGLAAGASVEPVEPVRRRASDQRPDTAQSRFSDQRRIAGVDAEQPRQGKAPAQAAVHRETSAGRPAPAGGAAVGEAAYARATFLVQLMGQEGRLATAERGVGFRSELSEQSNALERGSEFYRQAGAEPELYSEAPAIFRMAV